MDYYDLNMRLLEKKDNELACKADTVPLNVEHSSFAKVSLAIDSNIDFSTSNTILVFGLGWGDHIKELLEKTTEYILIIVVEPDVSIFKTVLFKRDLSSILSSKRVNLIIGEEDPIGAIRLAVKEYYEIVTIGEFLIVEYPSSVKANLEYFDKLRRGLRQTDSSWEERAFIFECKPRLQKRILTNMEVLIKNPGIDGLDGKFKDRPAIIVSAGPSLDKNVGFLSRAKGYALIICVDTALKALLKHDIEPDLLVSSDPTEHNYRFHLQGMDLEDIYLVADIEVYPDAFSEFEDSIFIFSLFSRPLVRWIGDIIEFNGYMEEHGCVSHYAFDLANRMEANPIILIGQDLAYSGGKKYTSEVPKEKEERAKREAREEMIWVDDIDGNRVPTSYILYEQLQNMEKRIEKSCSTCIDATEGGARIAGTEITPLSRVINKYCQRPIKTREILKEARANYRRPSIKRLMSEFKALIEEYQVVSELCNRGEDGTRKLIGLSNDRSRREGLIHHLKSLSQGIVDCKRFTYINYWAIKPLLLYFQKSKEVDLIRTYKIFFNKVRELSESSTFGELKRTEERLRS